MKQTYRFADIPVRAVFQENYIQDQCRDYETGEKPAFTIEITPADVALEEDDSGKGTFPYGYLESLVFYRKFCEQAVYHDILLFHCSAVSVDGQAYLFTAPSGTGKSTHTALWREVFGERAVMVNDDKPLLKIENNRIYVYGTPWDGKHHISTNIKVPVKAVCLLGRGTENEIHRESFQAAYPCMLAQTYRADDAEKMKKTLELVNQFMAVVPVYSMKCTISKEAAQMAYDCMSAK